MPAYLDDLRAVVARAAPLLERIPDDLAARRPAPGAWSAKEVLGHLIDSASNNHQRFVRIQWQDDLVFPGYEQERWVLAQDYQHAPWTDLVTFWRTYNEHLARVMAAIPPDVRLRERRRHNLDELASKPVPRDQPATLDYFMADYVWHLKHHLAQIERTAGVSLLAPDGEASA
jgi:hypothetical protein